MTTLTTRSASAIARLRSYVPPSTTWYSLPLSRRAAVLILLFADKKGELRVVLTMRAAGLSSYAGQAALPGGKSDTVSETPLQTARREAFEEIGLPPPSPTATHSLSDEERHDTKHSPPTPNLPYPFKLEHLCQLPTNLAKTELGVRPCVAYLYATSPTDKNNKPVDAEGMLIPRLDAKEVAAVFSGPFHNFLKLDDEGHSKGNIEGQWYKGQWTDWHETKFRMHNFYVPVRDQVVTRPKRKNSSGSEERDTAAMTRALENAAKEAEQLDQTSKYNPQQHNTNSGTKYPAPSRTLPYRDIPPPHNPTTNPDPLDSQARFRVFGMTARILVDCARVAYDEEPEFEHNSHFGDEAIIQRLIDIGRMEGEKGKGDEFEGNDLAQVLSGGGFGGLVQSRSNKRQGKL